MNRQPFVTGEVYHIYNRGVEKRVIFPDESYFSRFVSMVKHYLEYDYPYSVVLQKAGEDSNPKRLPLNSLDAHRWEQPPVKILSFCLMPNHFHFQIRQLRDGGISIFMHRLGTGYTNYFNLRHERSGRLFEGPFKSSRVESEGQFLCLHRYIHVNPIAAGLVDRKSLAGWLWSSLPEYLDRQQDGVVCDAKEIFSYFKDRDDYLDFILADFQESEKQDLERLAIDDDFGWFEEQRETRKEVSRRVVESLRCG